MKIQKNWFLFLLKEGQNKKEYCSLLNKFKRKIDILKNKLKNYYNFHKYNHLMINLKKVNLFLITNRR